MEREDAEFRAANERITAMAEELRKAELVRDRLEALDEFMGSYPEGYAMRARLESLQVDRALEGVNEDIRVLRDALLYPRGTRDPTEAVLRPNGVARKRPGHPEGYPGPGVTHGQHSERSHPSTLRNRQCNRICNRL